MAKSQQNNAIKPRILMLAPSCYPPGNPEAFVNANLVSSMLEAGWGVDVVTCADNVYHWYPESAELWKDVAQHAHNVEERARTLVHRLLSGAECFLLSGHIIGGGRWAVPAARRALKLATSRMYDVIISRSLPSSAHLSAYIVADKTGIPWIANWNDPDPDYKFPEPYARGNGAGTQMGFWETRYYGAMAKKAAWHTFPCERLRSYICGYLPLDVALRSSVVPHLASEPYRRKGGRGSIFSLLYAGSLRPPRDPTPFLRGVRIFLNQAPTADLSVRFITDKPDAVSIAVREQTLEKCVHVEPGKSYAEMSTFLAEAEVLVIIEANMKEGIFFPSKFVDYVQTGRPILAISPKVGVLSDILKTHGGGLAVDCDQPDAIAGGIKALYESWRAGLLDERFASDRLIKMFDKDAILGCYLEIFGKLGLHCSG